MSATRNQGESEIGILVFSRKARYSELFVPYEQLPSTLRLLNQILYHPEIDSFEVVSRAKQIL